MQHSYNNQLKSETNESNIPRNGASQIVRNMVSTTQSTEVEGFTYTSSWAHSAHELMLLNILFDFDRQMEETKKEGSVILNERAIRVGFSYAGHPKFGNLFQSAFVMQKSNQIM